MDSIKANFRVVRERGIDHTEVFVTATKPALNFSMYLPGDAEVETGQYEISFKRVEAPAEEPATAAEQPDDTSTPAAAPAAPAKAAATETTKPAK